MWSCRIMYHTCRNSYCTTNCVPTWQMAFTISCSRLRRCTLWSLKVACLKLHWPPFLKLAEDGCFWETVLSKWLLWNVWSYLVTLRAGRCWKMSWSILIGWQLSFKLRRTPSHNLFEAAVTLRSWACAVGLSRSRLLIVSLEALQKVDGVSIWPPWHL